MLELNKIYLGDCLQVMKDIADKSIDCIITDPPYGTTACKWDSVIPFEPMWEQLKRVTKKNGAIVLFGSQPFTSALVMSNPKMFKYEWVWEKSRPTGFLNAKKQPLRNVENISVFYSEQPTYNPQMKEVPRRVFTRTKGGGTYGEQKNIPTKSDNGGLENPYLLIKFNCENGKHPTQKPVALIEYLIKTYTNENEIVLDFTIGSGTTAVACIDTGRNFIGIEKDDKYFDIANKRIKDTLEQQTTATIQDALRHFA